MNKKGFLGISIVDIWVYTIFVLLIIGFFAGFKLAKPTTIKSKEIQLIGLGGHLQTFLETKQELEGKKMQTKEIIPFILRYPEKDIYKNKIKESLDSLESKSKNGYALCVVRESIELDCYFSKSYFASESIAPPEDLLKQMIFQGKEKGILMTHFTLWIGTPLNTPKTFHFIINPIK